MSENKCCGNCKFFEYEDITGKGWCNEQSWVILADKTCNCYESQNNGWVEITPYNLHEIFKLPRSPIVAYILNGETILLYRQTHSAFKLYAKKGGYYYYVLPELKKEEAE